MQIWTYQQKYVQYITNINQFRPTTAIPESKFINNLRLLECRRLGGNINDKYNEMKTIRQVNITPK